MNLAEKIIDIRNSAQNTKHNTAAWKHHEQMMEFLKYTGVYQSPSPMSYITEGYTPPAICNLPMTLSENSQAENSQLLICRKTQQ